jgi:hypothetical protein
LLLFHYRWTLQALGLHYRHINDVHSIHVSKIAKSNMLHQIRCKGLRTLQCHFLACYIEK